MPQLPAIDKHLTNLLGAFVTAVDDDMTRALEAEVGSAGSTPAALLAIDTWPDGSIDSLGGVLGLTHSGTVRLVSRLVADGLVERRAGADARTAALRLTSSGRGLMRRARRARQDVLDEVMSRLAASNRTALAELLDQVLRSRARSRAEARHACRLCDHSVCRGETCPIGASADEV